MTTKERLLNITRAGYDGDETSLLRDVFPSEWVPPDDLMPDPGRNLTPVPTSCHGEIAANAFWAMVQHDVNHGSQLISLRKLAEV